MKAKEQFIRNNKKAFDDLGVSINSVTAAENLLIANKDRFINAQIAKAKAAVYSQQAMDKVKELMALEAEYRSMPDKITKTETIKHGGGIATYYTYKEYQVANKEKEELGKEIESLTGSIKQGYKNAMIEEKNASFNLKKAGIEAVNTIKEGTIPALEQAISEKQEKLRQLQIGSSDYQKTRSELNKLQSELDNAMGNRSGGNGGGRNTGSKGQDPFLAKLAKYKSEYTRFMKWMNSGDEILIKSANQEFAGLLKQGATYIDYLKNQRETILQVDVANRTKAQNKQLEQLNNAIAEETKKTVLEAFNNELSEQLGNAKTVLEMLNIIEQKRKELSGDGTELDNSKKETLDDAEKNAQSKLKDETESLLTEYASYMEKRRRIDEQYNTDMELLKRKRAQAQTDSERAELDSAMKNRTKKYEDDTKGSGNADYDSMLADYGSYEQRKQAIIDEYDKKRRTVEEMGNQDMVDALNKAQEQALSKFALDQMKMSPDWALMFGDLDEISTKKLEELIAKINNLDGAYLGIEFSPEELKALKKAIEDMKGEIEERNPFKALVSSIKDYSKATDKEAKKKSLKNMFESANGAIDLVKGSFDAVVSGIEKMGISMDENTQAILGDIGGILDGAGQISQGIATGNPLAVIQGSISLLSSAFDLFNSRDRKAEKQIKKHESAIKDLENAYKQLEWQIDKALGTDVYDGQMQAIRNMEQQQQHLQGMWEAEESKKKTDSDKVRDYKEQYAELGRQIEDMYDEIANDILQTDAKDFAGTLGDSLVEAFKKGEDASKAFEETVNEVLQNAIVNQLKKTFLEKQLQGALDQLQGDMGYWNGDDFVFDGLTDAEIAAFKEKVQAAANNYNQALGIYSDLLKDLTGDEDSDTSLSGAVKGVTEETASLVAGQMNAIRINQLEATQVLRQSLQTLNAIAANTQYNRYLVKIDRIISLLESSGNSLRSQGLS